MRGANMGGVMCACDGALEPGTSARVCVHADRIPVVRQAGLCTCVGGVQITMEGLVEPARAAEETTQPCALRVVVPPTHLVFC